MTATEESTVPDPGGASRRREHHVLVVDDEADILESLQGLLETSLEDVVVHVAPSGHEALRLLETRAMDLIVSDFKMPGMNGLEFLESARKKAPGCPRVLVTAFPDLQLAIRAINEAGIENFFTKPFDPAQVVNVVGAILSERRSREMRDQSFARSLDLLRKDRGAGR